jgi:uncharacterized protein (DUF1330 family)
MPPTTPEPERPEPTAPDEAFTIAFVGFADAEHADAASAFEDEVLPLLADHGARVVYRGRRAAHEDAALPLEVHLLWFPHRRSFAAYLADERRQALLTRYGEVFTVKHAFEIDALG